jgi:hypothetical protein
VQEAQEQEATTEASQETMYEGEKQEDAQGLEGELVSAEMETCIAAHCQTVFQY